MASDFERCIDLVHQAMSDPTLGKYLFRIAEPEHTMLRRIVWIPTDYESLPSKRTNPLREVDGRIARVLGRENWSVEAHVTAESFEALDAVRIKLLYVVHELFGTESVPNGGTWTTQDEGVAGVMYAGASKCVMRFLWSFNVITHATPALVTRIETTPTLVDEVQPPFVQTEIP